MKETILIVDDEVSVRQTLSVGLTLNGYRIVEADSGEMALLRARQCNPDAILLGGHLPDMSGVEVTRRLRRLNWTPILLVSISDELDSVVSALDAGADDYLIQPFRMPELLARLRAALRRKHVPVLEGVLQCGKISLDQDARVVSIEGQRVSLTPNEFAILQTLMLHQGRVVSHRQLLTSVWGESSTSEPHLLRVHVSNLRRKLEAHPALPEYLVNEPGLGYRLSAPSEEARAR